MEDWYYDPYYEGFSTSPEYRSAIVDELNEVVTYTTDMSEQEINDILDSHAEYRLTCVPVWG